MATSLPIARLSIVCLIQTHQASRTRRRPDPPDNPRLQTTHFKNVHGRRRSVTPSMEPPVATSAPVATSTVCDTSAPKREEQDCACAMNRTARESSLNSGTRASWWVHRTRGARATLAAMLQKTLNTTPLCAVGSIHSVAESHACIYQYTCIHAP